MATPHPVLVAALLACLLVAAPCFEADASWSLVGVRGGFSFNVPNCTLYQFEAFGDYALPWELRAGSGWGVSTQLSASAGVLAGEGDYGFIGTAGPALAAGKTGFPLSLSLGISAAILSLDSYGRRDYNGYVQFISHAGLDYRFGNGPALTYRFQHMSNAGFNGNHNPGVNTHLFGIGWYLNP